MTIKIDQIEIPVEKDGSEIIKTSLALNFTGTGVAVTSAGGKANIAVSGGGGSESPLVEEVFTTLGTETPGDPTSFALTKTPGGGGSADTPSGYHLLVYCNGKKMGYVNPPVTYEQYYYDSVNNEIDVLASGFADDYEVVMVEATSSWASYAGHMEDKPPTSPSVYDDEFEDVSLDPSWSWQGAGEPSGAGHSWSLENGRLTMIVSNDGSGPPSTSAHTLWKTVTLSSDALFIIKPAIATFNEYAQVGFIFSDSTWNNIIMVSMQYYSYPRIDVSLITGGTPNYNIFAKAIYKTNTFVIGAAWDNATSQINAKVGFDSDNMATIYNYTPGWTPTRAGIFVRHVSGSTDPTIGKFEWFRAVIA